MRGKSSTILYILVIVFVYSFGLLHLTFADDASVAMLQRLGIQRSITELHQRVERGDAKIVKLLLKSGMYPDAEVNLGITPLMVAAEKGHVDVVKILLEYGAHVDAREQLWSHTPLMLAAQNGKINVIQELIKAGANVNAKTEKRTHFGVVYPGGDSVLMLALRKKQNEAVKKLIDSGADISSMNEAGETALALAKQQGDASLISLVTPAMKSRTELALQ